MCIQMGDAYATFNITRLGDTQQVELQVHNPTNRRASHRGYTVELTSVDPFPFTFTPINPADDRVTITASR